MAAARERRSARRPHRPALCHQLAAVLSHEGTATMNRVSYKMPPACPLEIHAGSYQTSRSPIILYCLVCQVLGLCLFAGCGAIGKTDGGATATPSDAIERTAEKGPVKLFVRVTPREPRLSDLVEMDVSIE